VAKKKLKRAGDGPDRVYKALRDIIVEQTLALGARLPEDAVATRFGVSRTVVRAAIARLVADGLVERPRNQVARVASPTREEADDLMAVRAELEASIVARLAKDVTAKQLEKLRAHVREEEGALKDRGRAVRLSGEFHVLLAAATGSKLFERYMVDIIARSSLVFTAQTTTNALCCSPREHAEIIDAIEKRDVAKAQARMRSISTIVPTGPASGSVAPRTSRTCPRARSGRSPHRRSPPTCGRKIRRGLKTSPISSTACIVAALRVGGGHRRSEDIFCRSGAEAPPDLGRLVLARDVIRHVGAG
jgi:DNA-binding GntR family transcriptional regulator